MIACRLVVIARWWAIHMRGSSMKSLLVQSLQALNLFAKVKRSKYDRAPSSVLNSITHLSFWSHVKCEKVLDFVSFRSLGSAYQLLFALLYRQILSNDAGPDEKSCEYRKKGSHTLFAVGDDGSPITGSSVIVLNAVNDSVCNLQCAVGYYHYPLGNKAPFSCAPNPDRTSRKGNATYPIICLSSLHIFCYHIVNAVVLLFQVDKVRIGIHYEFIFSCVVCRARMPFIERPGRRSASS